jgi:hypothetical protein
MFGWFRKRGKHDLGAAVTAIPSMPIARVVPASYGAFSHPEVPAAPVAEPVVVPAAEPAAPVLAAQPVAPAPRVELGFRDGTALALAPGSEQAKALSDIASVLTQRD